MSRITRAASCSQMESGRRRESEVREKAWMNKIEKVFNEHKYAVNKIKELKPKLKGFMKQKGNVCHMKEC